MKTCVLFAVVAAALCAQVPVPPDLPPETVVATVDGRAITIAELRGLLENSPPNLIQAFQQRPQFAIQQLYMMRYLAAEGEKAKLAERSPIKEQLEIMRANIVAPGMVALGLKWMGNPESPFYIQPRWDADLLSWGYRFWRAATAGHVRRSAPLLRDLNLASRACFEEFAALPDNDFGLVKKGLLMLCKTCQAFDEEVKTAEQARRLEPDRLDPEGERFVVVGLGRFGRSVLRELLHAAPEGSRYLVVERSEDATSKAAGGDFGVIKHNSSYSDDIKKAVFALKPGEVSDPVRQGNGFYIIRLEEKSVQPLDDVREPIVQEIRQAHLNDWFNALTRRFEPKIEKPEFFARPSSALPLPKSAARPNPLGPGKP